MIASLLYIPKEMQGLAQHSTTENHSQLFIGKHQNFSLRSNHTMFKPNKAVKIITKPNENRKMVKITNLTTLLHSLRTSNTENRNIMGRI